MQALKLNQLACDVDEGLVGHLRDSAGGDGRVAQREAQRTLSEFSTGQQVISGALSTSGRRWTLLLVLLGTVFVPWPHLFDASVKELLDGRSCAARVGEDEKRAA